MIRPWLTLPPLLADHTRAIRLLHLSSRDLRRLHGPPPESERCWRTTPEGREWQAALTAVINTEGGHSQ